MVSYVDAVVAVTLMHVLLFVLQVCMLREYEGAGVGVVVVGAVHVVGTCVFSSFVSSNCILPFVYTSSGIFVELQKVIQSAGMCE